MNSYLICHDPDPKILSRRQRQIVALTAHGMRGRPIAALLGLSPKTVENTLRWAYRKLDIHDRVCLARWAIAHRIDSRTPLSLKRPHK
jgi:DNA-binding CsgD family transcriptional regulator